MAEIKRKILIGLLVLAFVPAVIFFVAMFGRIPAENTPEETVMQETAAVQPTEETVPTTEQTQPPTEPATEATEATEQTVPVETEAPVVFDTVPLYYQTDYPHLRYGTGTVANSGCVVTSLSMVASYLTGHEYLPDQMLEFFDNFIGTNVEWLEYASDQLQLPWFRAANVHVALEALREGKIVIAVMNENSYFTNGQHFIVLTGVNEEDLILVNDPNEDNYSAWNLKDGFENGFRDGLIINGFSGAWVYDPEAMPEEPFIYEEPPAVECRYPDVELTEAEIDLMAKLIWSEAQGEPYEGQQAIAEVILNRLVAEKFQSTINGIVYADNQFGSADVLYLAKPTHVQYEAIERALYGPYILPIDVVYFATYPVTTNVWGDIGNHTFCYAG